MPEKLLENSLVVWKTISPGVCLISGRRIPRGEYSVMCVPHDEDAQGFYISIPAVEQTRSQLERCSFGEKTTLGSEGDVAVVPANHASSVDYDRCVVCDESVAPESPHVQSFAFSSGSWAFLHPDCVDEFCEALDGVWELSDELLADHI